MTVTTPMTDLLTTPNIGTGVLEQRDRVDFGQLREARRVRVLAEMKARGLDACFFGREANARYVSGVRRLWTAQTRPFAPGCLLVLETGEVELLSFSASYEDMPAEVGPDHFFPVTWNPMNMVDWFARRPAYSTPGASGSTACHRTSKACCGRCSPTPSSSASRT